MVGLPLLALFVFPPKLLLPILWALTLATYLGVRRIDPKGKTGRWDQSAVTWVNLCPILLRFVACSGLLYAVTAYYKPDMIFSFMQRNPLFWALVMVLYPILSVIPQEIIYRRFVFARYGAILSTPRAMIFVSALGFGFAHIFLQNWIAPVLSAIGGCMFAATYQRTRSLALTSLEHALYGDMIFTLGLGVYFYHGAVEN